MLLPFLISFYVRVFFTVGLHDDEQRFAMDGQILAIVLASLMVRLFCSAGKYCVSPALCVEVFNGQEGKRAVLPELPDMA
jgi:hypothetical protein